MRFSAYHIGDQEVDTFIDRRRRTLAEVVPPGTIMDVYTTLNPKVIVLVTGIGQPSRNEAAKLALGLTLYREGIVVTRPLLRAVGG
jgi:hypothetical protein